MWGSDPWMEAYAWGVHKTWASRRAVWSQHVHVGLAAEDVRPLKCHLWGIRLPCLRFAVFCSVQKQHRAGLHGAMQLAKRLHSPTVCTALAITACDGGFFHQLGFCFHLNYFTRATIFKAAIFELLSFAFTCPHPPHLCIVPSCSVPFPDPHVLLFHHQTFIDIFLLFVGLTHSTSSFTTGFNLILCQICCCQLQ